MIEIIIYRFCDYGDTADDEDGDGDDENAVLQHVNKFTQLSFRQPAITMMTTMMMTTMMMTTTMMTTATMMMPQASSEMGIGQWLLSITLRPGGNYLRSRNLLNITKWLWQDITLHFITRISPKNICVQSDLHNKKCHIDAKIQCTAVGVLQSPKVPNNLYISVYGLQRGISE